MGGGVCSGVAAGGVADVSEDPRRDRRRPGGTAQGDPDHLACSRGSRHPSATIETLSAAHERVLASGAEQEQLIEALLTLARGQAGLDKREPFDLAAVISQVLAARQPEADSAPSCRWPILGPWYRQPRWTGS
jgi:signal transduction histidine kinase